MLQGFGLFLRHIFFLVENEGFLVSKYVRRGKKDIFISPTSITPVPFFKWIKIFFSERFWYVLGFLGQKILGQKTGHSVHFLVNNWGNRRWSHTLEIQIVRGHPYHGLRIIEFMHLISGIRRYKSCITKLNSTVILRKMERTKWITQQLMLLSIEWFSIRIDSWHVGKYCDTSSKPHFWFISFTFTPKTRADFFLVQIAAPLHSST